MDWLTFSLSNQPCFFDSFNSSQHGAVTDQADDVGGSSSLDLSLVGPKLENFLGGCNEPMGRPDHVDPGGGGGGGGGMYDSDLKTIAAGFLRGYPPELPQELPDKAVAVLQPESKSKAVDTFGQRTSIYRGVTRHRWTGRYEAHLWDNSCRREGQSRKGRQVYLGGYDKEEKAARAYDLAALKYWGPSTTTNFPVSNYEKEVDEMKNMTRQEFVASLRRKSSGFSRGASIYRGVTRHHQHGRWQARIGRVAGNKDLYLGTFSNQEEAAEAYDIAAIKFRGLNAVTNFDMSRYDVKSIATSNLPIGGMSARTTTTSSAAAAAANKNMLEYSPPPAAPPPPHNQQQQEHDYWTLLALHQQQHNQQFLFPSGAINMDFSSAPAQENGGCCCYVWNSNNAQQGEEHEQERQRQSNSVCSSIPYATPIGGVGGGGGGGGGALGNGTYEGAPSSMHAYPQTAKTSLGLFQTPIFGME